MDMQLELTTPVIAKRGAAWKKACATGAAALVVGCVAVSRVGNTASFDLTREGAPGPPAEPVIEKVGWAALKEKITAQTGGTGDKTFTRAKVTDCPVNADDDKDDKKKSNRKTCLDAIIKKIEAVKLTDLTNVHLSVADDIDHVDEYRKKLLEQLGTEYIALPDDPEENSAIISALTRLTEATVTIFKTALPCEALDTACAGDKVDECKEKLRGIIEAITQAEFDLAVKYGVKKVDEVNSEKAKECPAKIAKALEHLSSKDKTDGKTEYGPNSEFHKQYVKYGKSIKQFEPSTFNWIIVAIIVLLVALGGGCAYYFYMQQQKKKEVKVVDGQ